MKNIKLLLATTAILSTGALLANAATGDETVVPVRAEVVHVHNLHATPIDFGRIAVDDGLREEGEWLAVLMDSSGIETYNEDSNIPGYILSSGKKGVVENIDCEHLSFNDTIEMSVPNLNSNLITHASILCKTVDGEATFYGEFGLSVDVGDYKIPAGNYTGNLTVTEINPEP